MTCALVTRPPGYKTFSRFETGILRRSTFRSCCFLPMVTGSRRAFSFLFVLSEAAFQHFHQIHDFFRATLGMSFHYIFMPSVFLFGELQKRFRIFVSQFLRVQSFPGQSSDGGLELTHDSLRRLFPFLRQSDPSRRSDFVAEPQRVRAENAAVCENRHQVFLTTHYKSS